MSEGLKKFLGSDLLGEWADGELLLASASGGFHDFSFVVFPFAKCYEGFLKKLFFQIGAINKWHYENDRWRVGRALNPQLEKDLRHDESVYDRLVKYCGGSFDPAIGGAQDGRLLADRLWQAWKRGRNQLFHYYPGRFQPLSIAQAKEIVAEIEAAMEAALMGCRVTT